MSLIPRNNQNNIQGDNAAIKVYEFAQEIALNRYSVYEGDRSGDGKETTKGYQLNRKLKDYESEIKEVFRFVKRKNGYIKAYN